jgi:hypothetical protein
MLTILLLRVVVVAVRLGKVAVEVLEATGLRQGLLAAGERQSHLYHFLQKRHT